MGCGKLWVTITPLGMYSQGSLVGRVATLEGRAQDLGHVPGEWGSRVSILAFPSGLFSSLNPRSQSISTISKRALTSHSLSINQFTPSTLCHSLSLVYYTRATPTRYTRAQWPRTENLRTENQQPQRCKDATHFPARVLWRRKGFMALHRQYLNLWWRAEEIIPQNHSWVPVHYWNKR